MKTLLQRKIEQIENHPVLWRILLLGFFASILGGFMSFGENIIRLSKWILSVESDSITIKVQAQNVSTNLVTIDPLCEIELHETIRNGELFLPWSDPIRLVPCVSSFGTNDFCLRSKQIRDYQFRIENNSVISGFLERQASIIKLKVHTGGGNCIETNLPFQRAYISKEKAVLRITQ